MNYSNLKITIDRKYFAKSMGEILFIFALCLYMVSQLLDLTSFAHGVDGLINNSGTLLLIEILKKIALAILLVKIVLFTKYKPKWFYLYLFFAFVGVLIVISTNNNEIAYFVLFLLGSYNCNPKEFIAVSCIIICCFIIAMPVLVFLGIVDDYYVIESGRVRHFLGFSYTSHGASLATFFIFSYYYLKSTNLRIRDYIFALSIIILYFYYTKTRMPFAIALFTIFVFYLFNWWSKKRNKYPSTYKSIKILFAFLPVLVCVTTIILYYYYDSSVPIFNSLNKFLNNRFELGHTALKEYGFSLFGTDVKLYGYRGVRTAGVRYNYVDSSYIQILLKYGLILLSLVIVLYSYLLYKAYEKSDYHLIMVLVMVIIIAISDPRLIDLRFNVIPLIASSYEIYKKDR